MIVRGFGIGMSMMPSMTAAYAVLRPDQINTRDAAAERAAARRRLDRHRDPHRRPAGTPGNSGHLAERDGERLRLHVLLGDGHHRGGAPADPDAGPDRAAGAARRCGPGPVRQPRLPSRRPRARLGVRIERRSARRRDAALAGLREEFGALLGAERRLRSRDCAPQGGGRPEQRQVPSSLVSARTRSRPPARSPSGRGSSPGAVSGMLDELEQAGIVSRVRCADDRRRVLVNLTDAGRKVLGQRKRRWTKRWRTRWTGRRSRPRGRRRGDAADRRLARGRLIGAPGAQGRTAGRRSISG